MATLQVHSKGLVSELSLTIGQSVREALDSTELRVRAACGGTGACGLCRVRLCRGQANPHSLAEYRQLTAEERADGFRLACQLRPEGDLEIELEDPAPPSPWKSISAEELMRVSWALPALTQGIYGIAVDLGTTHIRVSLWDRKRALRIGVRSGLNPQAVFGADILNRLNAALVSPERAQELATLARSAILAALFDILSRDLGLVSPILREIGEVIIVGNPAMLALLTGTGITELLVPENWQRPFFCRPEDTRDWPELWMMPQARFLLPGSLAGFVGSDLLADLLATGLIDGPAGSLLLDVGTNTELALWDGHTLHLASVPGGPAFEGVGIRNGMPAETGAIWRVSDGKKGLHFETIGGGPARGLCGSGLIDAIAVLLAGGRLKPSGRFAVSPGPEGFALDPNNPRTAITGTDIDAFQRAKAATAAAMGELLAQAGLTWADLTRLCVCGAFGRRVNLVNAQAVGLLPPLDPARVELFANASLAGCEAALLSGRADDCFADLAARTRMVNLSLAPSYEDRYIDNLRLRPIALAG